MTSLRHPIANVLPLVATIGTCLTALLSYVAVAGEIRLGTAAVTITPPLGTPMAGYLSPRRSEGVLDDLYAKATVLDDGKTKVALVTCDLIGLSRPVVVAARRIIAEETGIPADNVMISATHTHNGPTVLGISAVADLVAGGNKLSREYAEQLPK